MTETNAQGASLTGKAFEYKPGSAGFPHPIVDIRICDEAGEPLPEGATGEIWVRSCSNIREYWRRPEANAEEFRDGWLKTGDIGYLDEEGFLFLADRAKDMVIRGGENIYPIEVENVLLELPAVKEAAVIGLPHERLGEEVAAIIHLHAGEALSEEQAVAFARSRLAAFKVPSRVFFQAEPLPRNATNKLLKTVLKARVLAGLQGEDVPAPDSSRE
jgi:acyl-CoA synthetase (AMP-forming)/AMP-acid ligase II